MRNFQKILFPTVWAVSMSAACASIGFSGLNGATFDLALADSGDLTGEDFTFTASSNTPFRVKAKVATGSTSVLTFGSGSGGTFTIPYTMTCTNFDNDVSNPNSYTFYYDNDTAAPKVTLTNSYHVLYTTKNQCQTSSYNTVCDSTKVTTNNNIKCSLHVNLTNGSTDLSKLPAGTYSQDQSWFACEDTLDCVGSTDDTNCGT